MYKTLIPLSSAAALGAGAQWLENLKSPNSEDVNPVLGGIMYAPLGATLFDNSAKNYGKSSVAYVQGMKAMAENPYIAPRVRDPFVARNIALAASTGGVIGGFAADMANRASKETAIDPTLAALVGGGLLSLAPITQKLLYDKARQLRINQMGSRITDPARMLPIAREPFTPQKRRPNGGISLDDILRGFF